MANNFYNDAEGRYSIKTLGIEDLDGAVYDYFEKKLSPTVSAGADEYKVPVYFASSERWALLRQNKFRDKHETLLLPVISIRRANIDRTRGFGGMAQEESYITVSKTIHAKTSNIQNRIQDRKVNKNFFHVKEQPPVIETLTIPFPDFCQVLYDIDIWCQYEQHMNEILEKIFYKYEHLDSFVMPVEYDGVKPKGNSYYFVGFREGVVSKQSNDDNFTNQERFIRYSYSIRVPAYFILNPDDEALSYGEDGEGKKVVYKKQSTNQVKLSEQVISLDEYMKIFG